MHNTHPIRIVVVDNASTDNSYQFLKEYKTKNGSFELLASPENCGYAQGNNIGLRFFEGLDEVTEVMILNNDVLFTEDIIPGIVSFISSHPTAGLVSPLLRAKDGQTIDRTCARKDCKFAEIIWSFLLYFTDVCGIISRYRNQSKIPIPLNDECVEIELPSGSCMVIDKNLFKDIGYFDPNTFLYFEENILYHKIKSIGRRNYLLPHISCIHLGGQTTNKVAHPAEYMIKSKRSAYYFAKTYRCTCLIQRMILEVSYRVFLCEVFLAKNLKRKAF